MLQERQCSSNWSQGSQWLQRERENSTFPTLEKQNKKRKGGKKGLFLEQLKADSLTAIFRYLISLYL